MLWDLKNYYCGYPELRTKGGKSARVTWGWTESLRDRNGKKGNRDEYIGKNAEQALTDVFIADGRGDALFTAPWWRCGRWCRLTVETAEEPLEIVSAAILETRYPLEDEGGFDCDEPSVAPIRSMCLRTLQMCAHEMFFDCPYYEQQMYGGDTRVEILYLSSVTRDDRLARFAMSVFDYDRRSDGIVAMNFPTRGTQESSTYTMCWITMFRDYAYRGTNAAWLKSRLPGARNAMEGLALYENGDGLLEHLPGWSFVDWAPEYDNGVPGQGVVNFQYLYTLKLLAETEEALGETAYAKIWRAKAERLAAKLQETLWDEKRGMMADEAAGRRFSEHAQCLAILSGMFPEDLCGRMFGGLTGAKDLVRTSLYFSHYLFETYFRFGRADLFFARLAVWKDQLAHGLKTAMETPRLESRSDCHAWSSGPLYALQAGVAGISPAAPFYRKVRVAPQPAHLKRIGCKAPHPDGFVEVNLDFSAGTADGAVSLPAGVTGVFEWKGVKTALKGGANVIGRGTRAGHKGLTDGS